MENIKYEDLACEFCNGSGEFSRDSGGQAIEGICGFCNGSGIDNESLKNLFNQRYVNNPCGHCGYTLDNHNQDNHCPNIIAGQLYGWHLTTFQLTPN